MPSRSSAANFGGLTGIPLFIATEMGLYGRGEQTHEEKMNHLSKAYGWVRAYLPAIYESKPEMYTGERVPRENGKASLQSLVVELSAEIDSMYLEYQPAYEGQRSCTGEEKKFLTIMRGVFERLALIISFSHICDKVSFTEEVYF